MVKVSIVVPICNVEKYLRQCLDSIANQTLKDIEVILVNDGSKDSSGAICDEYVAKDPRFSVIHKPNSGYGHSMNVGFDACTGEYIGIIESDDYADIDMFENLYNAAIKHKADVVKSNFFNYYSVLEDVHNFVPNIARKFCGKVFCPSTDLKGGDRIAFWNAKNTIWSAIYRKDFIRLNNIRFNETPGASFQDTSFSFKVWALAKRVFCVYAAYLHYRQDNMGSSVNSPGKVFCICDEYDEMDRFFAEHKELEYLYPIINRVKFDAYLWNIGRIADQFVTDFSLRTAKEFRDAHDKGHLDLSLFEPWKEDQLKWIMRVPGEFAKKTLEDRTNRVVMDRLNALQGELSRLNDIISNRPFYPNPPMPPEPKLSFAGTIAKKCRTAVSVFRHEGFSGLRRIIFEKMR